MWPICVWSLKLLALILLKLCSRQDFVIHGQMDRETHWRTDGRTTGWLQYKPPFPPPKKKKKTTKLRGGITIIYDQKGKTNNQKDNQAKRQTGFEKYSYDRCPNPVYFNIPFLIVYLSAIKTLTCHQEIEFNRVDFLWFCTNYEINDFKNIIKKKLKNTIFLLINAPGTMQNMVREPLFCTQFAKQKVCTILYIIVF